MPTTTRSQSARPALAARLTEQLRQLEMVRRYKVGHAAGEASRKLGGLQWAARVNSLIKAGQFAAAQEAIAYANAYVASMGGRPVSLDKAVRGVGEGYGRGSAGRTLERTRRQAVQVTERDGAAAGRRWLEARAKRVASDLVWLAARDTLQEAIVQHPDLTGYRRIASPMACGACLALATGAVVPPGEAFRDHPYCRCTLEPVVRGAPLIQRPTGEGHVAAMSEQEQNNLFGREKAELLRSGDIKLADLAHRPAARIGRRQLIVETPLSALKTSA